MTNQGEIKLIFLVILSKLIFNQVYYNRQKESQNLASILNSIHKQKEQSHRDNHYYLHYNIENQDVKNLDITIKNCNFQNIGDISLNNIREIYNVIHVNFTFKNCDFNESIPKISPDLNSLKFNNCKFIKYKISSNTNLSLSFENCEFESIELIDFKGHITLKEIEGEEFTITRGFIDNLDLNGIIKTNIKIGESDNEITKVNELLLSSNCQLEVLDIINSTIGYICLQGRHNLSSSILIDNITVDKFYLKNFISLGIVRFSRINYDEFTELKINQILPYNLHINNCHFKDLNLFSLKLDTFPSIRLINTDLSKVRINNTVFPIEKLISEPHSMEEGKRILEDLSQAALNQNDTKMYLDYFQASRDIELKRLIQNSNHFDSSLPKSSIKVYIENTIAWIKALLHGKDKGSTWSLSISKWYSDHGTNWIKASKVFLLIGFIGFIALMSCTKYPCEFTMKTSYSRFFSFFLQFLSPTHKLNFMNTDSIGGLFVFIDIFSRILMGIGIFEIIKSFRKYSRK